MKYANMLNIQLHQYTIASLSHVDCDDTYPTCNNNLPHLYVGDV